ncbi:hypothetical protein Goshw_015985 [Gossypium schwendimanii]|uniref:DUF7745 domain-containing protein n=1 Tax=Gossypium schwendimanii TaxID=34291 RepID=A0A7J9M4F1_GOSSC|nr:hypothetical protein [Gossypium schwendimanii]
MEKGFLIKWRIMRLSELGLKQRSERKVDKHLFQALAQSWNPAYSCFTFGKVNLAPTIEEYVALLRCSKFQINKFYSRAVNMPTFLKKLMNITGMNVRKKVDAFALSIYGLVISPKALGHVDEAVTDLFDRLDKWVTPIPAILAETFRSLSACRKVFSKSYSPLKEIVATLRRDDISEEKWMAILQNLQEEDVKWRAPWLLPDEILYRCGNFDWVPLLGIWGAVGYAPLDDGYRKKIQEISTAWKQTHRMKRLAVGPMKTPKYNEWWAGKNSEQWREEIQEEKDKVDIWEQKFQELKASLSKIEEMKKRIEELETELQNCEIRIETWKQMKVADVLSVKYELELDRGQGLALLLRKTKVLSIRAKPYL